MDLVKQALMQFGAELAQVEAYIAAHPQLFDTLAAMVAANHPLAAIILHQIALYLAPAPVPPPAGD